MPATTFLALTSPKSGIYIPKELDKVYPCARNESFFDAPGIPFNNANEKGYQSWRVIDDFELYIMYRPKGNNKSETEKNEKKSEQHCKETLNDIFDRCDMKNIFVEWLAREIVFYFYQCFDLRADGNEKQDPKPDV